MSEAATSASPSKRDLTISFAQANIFALLASGPPVVPFVLLYGQRWGSEQLSQLSSMSSSMARRGRCWAVSRGTT